MKHEITILIDKREQKPWSFPLEDYKSNNKSKIIGSEAATIDAGDYAIKEYFGDFRIERKANIQELYGNMSPIGNKERFYREMEKLRDIPYKYIVLESSLSSDLLSLSVPQYRQGPPCSVVIKWLFEIQMEYGVVPIFAGPCGNKVAKYLIEEFVKRTL